MSCDHPLWSANKCVSCGFEETTEADEIQERFEAFHSANPHVYEHLVEMARQWQQAGHNTCAIGMLFEVLRWEIGVSTKSQDNFRLNNNFRSRYARFIMDMEPQLEGFFEIRELTAKS